MQKRERGFQLQADSFSHAALTHELQVTVPLRWGDPRTGGQGSHKGLLLCREPGAALSQLGPKDPGDSAWWEPSSTLSSNLPEAPAQVRLGPPAHLPESLPLHLSARLAGVHTARLGLPTVTLTLYPTAWWAPLSRKAGLGAPRV